MKIALLCPGPSLAYVDSLVDYDVRIGVNRAVHRVPCDWWVFGDARVFWRYKPDRLPDIFTSVETAKKCWIEADLNHEEVTWKYPLSLKWGIYSMLCGMVLADWLGAKTLDIYGCDWQGTADWDGYKYEGQYFVGEGADQTRTAQRFDTQQVLYKTLIPKLACEVKRINYGIA